MLVTCEQADIHLESDEGLCAGVLCCGPSAITRVAVRLGSPRAFRAVTSAAWSVPG